MLKRGEVDVQFQKSEFEVSHLKLELYEVESQVASWVKSFITHLTLLFVML